MLAWYSCAVIVLTGDRSLLDKNSFAGGSIVDMCLSCVTGLFDIGIMVVTGINVNVGLDGIGVEEICICCLGWSCWILFIALLLKLLEIKVRVPLEGEDVEEIIFPDGDVSFMYSSGVRYLKIFKLN